MMHIFPAKDKKATGISGNFRIQKEKVGKVLEMGGVYGGVFLDCIVSN
jgi:hypothetical protein